MTMTDDQSDRMWMTPRLNRIADVVGLEPAFTLARAKAGERIYIPEIMTPDHWLAQLIGLDAANKMAVAFGSQKLLLPPALTGDKRRRAAAIAELLSKGYSTNAIARALGVSASTVLAHRNKRPSEDRQLKLL